MNKKRILINSAAVIMAAALVLPSSAFAAQNGAEQYIGEAKAKAIALENAGISEEQATFLKVHLDHEDGQVVYDVEFLSGNAEYDYEINAADGRIIEHDMDIEYYSIPSASSTTTNADEYISETEAKATALSHAGIAESDAVFVKAHLDHDDGRIVYDIEFISGGTEYDYEIDAISGEIHEFDREIEYYATANNKPAAADTANFIGEDKAKSAALSHAGLSESQVSRMKVKFDRDDGRMTYEVEFDNDRMEYEYEIDAVSGTVLEYDAEFDD